MTPNAELRIGALVAWAASCAWASPSIAAGLAIAAGLVVHAAGAGDAFRALLRRARWLLLFVVLMNAFGTPGPAAWPDAPARIAGWMPSAAGLALATHRAACLVAMLAAVAWLLRATAVPALVDGLTRIAAPLAPFGLEPTRFGARLGGAIAALGAQERDLREAARARGWLDALAAQVVAIETRA